MARIKFFVHGGGTWREVDTNNGCVTGWGKIQFVYVRRGRLVIARRNSVLKGLRALAAGEPTTVRDGPQLSQIRRKKKAKTKQPNELKQLNQYSHCCSCQHNSHHQQSISDTLFNGLLKPITNSTATQCAFTADNATQVTVSSDTDKYSQIEKIKPIERRARKRVNDEPRKELIIDEDDVLLVRNFIEQDAKNVFNMPLVDFDTDDNCKRNVFYKINPLVVVSRSRRIAEMIRPQSQCSSVSLKDFIATLGLQSVDEVSKKSKYKMRARKSQENQKNDDSNESETDKENISLMKSNRGSRVLTNNINKSSKTQKFLQVKRRSSRFLKDTENNKNKNERKVHSSDNETFKLSLKSDAFLKRSQQKVLNNGRNVMKEVGSSKNKSLRNDNSRKLLISKDHGDEGDKTEKEYGKNNSKQTTTVRSNNNGKINQEKLIEQELKSRRAKNNKTFNTRSNTAEVNKGQNYNKKKKESEDVSSVNSTDEESLLFKEKTTKTSKNENAMVATKENDKKERTGNIVPIIKKSKRNCSRPYSRLEDEAIVSWLRGGERAHLVNGNRVWKELEPLHHKTTGHFRPWQSLRNRYLRYILPALAELALPPAAAQQLRAAAAEGEIKTKTTPASSNSIFKDTRVRSAWALRPRSPIRSPPSLPLAAVPPTSVPPTSVPPNRVTSSSNVSLRGRAPPATASALSSTPASAKMRRDSTSSHSSGTKAVPKRALRSSAAHSPTLPTPKTKMRRSSLTYSELTRRFADRHRSTPQPQNTASSNSRQAKRLRSTITQSSDDTSSDELDRSAKRLRSGAQRSDSIRSDASGRRARRSKSKTPERPRTRRLYNPHVV